MKNFAIHSIINSKPFTVNLHGMMTKESFKLSHLKNKIVPKAQQLLLNRIELLSVAEKLAMEDKNLSNYDENMSIITRCITGKIELMSVLHELKRAA